MDRIEVGRLGEAEAARYLKARGWKILASNVRVGRRELDIISRRGRVLAFVEVKTRRGDSFGGPLEAITLRKQGEIIKAAAEWLRNNAIPAGTVVRFDAVGIIWTRKGDVRVEHVPDAWRKE